MKTISKLWQGFKKHIDKFFFIFVLLLLVALAVAVMVSECIACCLQQFLGLTEKYDVLQTIGFCIVAVLLVWQAWTANKRADAMDDTAKSAATGQQEKRLKNAIEHLGHENETVRMGGAHELFRLAKGRRDLRQDALDILCAHVRQTTSKYKYKRAHGTKPSEEIQSLLTLLFVQEHDVFEGCSINLQGSYLNGADLKHVQLQDANLRDAQLQGADLMEAQLQGANLSKAQLQEAHFYKAQLQKADLTEAQLQGANFSKAQLQKADVTEEQLQGAILKETKLKGVIGRAYSLLLSFVSSYLSSFVSSYLPPYLSSLVSSFVSSLFKRKK